MIRSGVSIAAAPARVWQILAAFGSYAEWNPFIREISGVLEPGRRLRVKIVPHGHRERVFAPRIIVATPGKELRWRGRWLLPGLFDGEHSFTIEPDGAGCRFRQDETFSGVLTRFVGQEVLMATRSGFEEMNAALKHRAETG
jgi:hypothetical protein